MNLLNKGNMFGMHVYMCAHGGGGEGSWEKGEEVYQLCVWVWMCVCMCVCVCVCVHAQKHKTLKYTP